MRRPPFSPFPCLIALVLLASCGANTTGRSSAAGPNPCEKSFPVKGTITSIHNAPDKSFLGSFLLNGTKEQRAAFDQVVIRVTTTTQIFEKQSSECRTASFTSLQPGQRLQIQTTGITAQSYPPQVEATEIIILPAS